MPLSAASSSSSSGGGQGALLAFGGAGRSLEVIDVNPQLLSSTWSKCLLDLWQFQRLSQPVSAVHDMDCCA
jgi:hypothetical protein